MTGRRLSVRDYKGPRRDGPSGWLRPFALGLALGLVVAAVVFIQTRHHFLLATADTSVASTSNEDASSASGGDAAHAKQNTPTKPTSPGGSAPSNSATGNNSNNSNRVAASGGNAAGPAVAALPKFDFYQMLPRSQVLIPSHESETHLPAGASLDRAGTYFLQIGSYKDPAVADRVRAQVQKLGVTVSVQRIVVDSATWHRVRVGPIRDLNVLNRVRHQLQAGNLEAMIVRVTP